MATLGLIRPLQVPLFAGMHRGFAALFALATLQILIGVLVGQKTFLDYFIITAGRQISLIVLLVLCWLIYRAIESARKNKSPFLHIREMLAHDYLWFIRGSLIIALAVPANLAFTTIKVAIPFMVPYYADSFFIEVDRLLFLGTDPWRITHALIGPMGTYAIDWLYSAWFTVVGFILLWASFSRDPQFQLRASVAHLLTWFLIGSVAAVALSSTGPCFADPILGNDHFAPLMERLHGYGPLWSTHWQEYLLETRTSEALGKGISAMPSVHVAVTFLLYLMFRDRFGARHWTTLASLAYVIVIWIGSVHLAWHYAIDGAVSVILTLLIWNLSALFSGSRASDAPAKIG